VVIWNGDKRFIKLYICVCVYVCVRLFPIIAPILWELGHHFTALPFMISTIRSSQSTLLLMKDLIFKEARRGSNDGLPQKNAFHTFLETLFFSLKYNVQLTWESKNFFF
jgi:hypothetical protein